MQTLREIQLSNELQYGSTARTFFYDDIPAEHGFPTDAIAEAVYSLLLLHTGDILIQNAISMLLRGMGKRPCPDSIGEALAVFESSAFAELAEVHCVEGGHAFIRSKISLGKEAKERTSKAMYLPPMVMPPNDWTCHTDGGYLTERLPAILGWKNRHNGHINYSALNAAQGVQLTIDGWAMLTFEDTVAPALRDNKEEIATYAALLGRPFHFVWQYDSRGRMYSHGHHVNIQARSFKKAMINFHKTEPLTEEGCAELLYAIGEAAGQRRKNFDDQVAEGYSAVLRHLEAYEEGGAIDFDEAYFVKHGIKDRIGYIKLLKAYLEWQVDGVEQGIMVSNDATSSGLQIMAALTNCPTTMKLTNLTSTERECAYTHILNVMDSQLGEGQKIDRDIGKQCLMTHYYCSVATPQQLLTPEQLHVFYEQTQAIFTGPEAVMSAIINAWTDKDTFTWTLPDGHVANVKCFDKEVVDIEWHGSEFLYEFNVHKANANWRHLAANVIQSFDGYIARQMQLCAEFDLVIVHDCFMTHPNHAAAARQLYRKIMQDICDNNYLQDVLREITGNKRLVFQKHVDRVSVTSDFCICS